MWSIIKFGKHKGKSLPEVILHDPDWFFWAVEAHYFDKHPAYRLKLATYPTRPATSKSQNPIPKSGASGM